MAKLPYCNKWIICFTCQFSFNTIPLHTILSHELCVIIMRCLGLQWHHPVGTPISKWYQHQVNTISKTQMIWFWHQDDIRLIDLKMISALLRQIDINFMSTFSIHFYIIHWHCIDVTWMSILYIFIAINYLCPGLISVWHQFDTKFWYQENFH